MDRREFLGVSFPAALVGPLLLGRGAFEVGAAERRELRVVARWEEEGGEWPTWRLHFGWEGSLTHVKLYQYSHLAGDATLPWTLRLGGMEVTLPGCASVDEAKRFAELEVVGWIRSWLVEMERLAYRVE